MPEGDSITLSTNIRTVNKTLPVVILVTGYSDISEEECLKKGANAVLEKPITAKALTTALMSALGLMQEMI